MWLFAVVKLFVEVKLLCAFTVVRNWVPNFTRGHQYTGAGKGGGKFVVTGI